MTSTQHQSIGYCWGEYHPFFDFHSWNDIVDLFDAGRYNSGTKNMFARIVILDQVKVFMSDSLTSPYVYCLWHAYNHLPDTAKDRTTVTRTTLWNNKVIRTYARFGGIVSRLLPPTLIPTTESKWITSYLPRFECLSVVIVAVTYSSVVQSWFRAPKKLKT